jgi:hypothetical protein
VHDVHDERQRQRRTAPPRCHAHRASQLVRRSRVVRHLVVEVLRRRRQPRRGDNIAEESGRHRHARESGLTRTNAHDDKRSDKTVSGSCAGGSASSAPTPWLGSRVLPNISTFVPLILCVAVRSSPQPASAHVFSRRQCCRAGTPPLQARSREISLPQRSPRAATPNLHQPPRAAFGSPRHRVPSTSGNSRSTSRLTSSGVNTTGVVVTPVAAAALALMVGARGPPACARSTASDSDALASSSCCASRDRRRAALAAPETSRARNASTKASTSSHAPSLSRSAGSTSLASCRTRAGDREDEAAGGGAAPAAAAAGADVGDG